MTLETRLAALIAAIGPDIKALATGKASKAYGGQETITIPSQSSGTLTINVANGNYQIAAAVNANITSWVWQNLPSSEGCCINLFLPMGSTLRTISTAIGGTVHWLSPVPTHVINKFTVYTLVTPNGGTDWFVAASVEA